MKKKWIFYRAGHIERGKNYQWRDGYSRVTENGTEYPWLTMREAQSYAKKNGAKAVFCETEKQARIAMEGEKP
jgi:hypothetical protein